jgi:hypothetical protein
MKDVQALPGADIDSEHSLLLAKICIRLKKITNLETQTWTVRKADQQYLDNFEM